MSTSTIATQNSELLGKLSLAFCLMNGILNVTPELAKAFAATVTSNIIKWYIDNGHEDFSPETTLICDEAIKYAFGEMQTIVTLAQMSAEMGLSPEAILENLPN